MQVDAWVAVGEVFPEQQRVFVLFPRQAVTVIVKVKGLPSVGSQQRAPLTRSPAAEARTGEERAPPRWVRSCRGAVPHR